MTQAASSPNAKRPNAAWTLSLALLGAALLPGLAAGHDMPYIQPNTTQSDPPLTSGGTSQFDCTPGNHPVLNVGIGGVCFGAGKENGWDNDEPCSFLGCPGGTSGDPQHITAAATAVLDVPDTGFPGGVAASYCQDLNKDLLCGGNLTGPPEAGSPSPDCQLAHREGAGACTLRAEPWVDLCDSITIRSGLTGEVGNGDPSGEADERLPGGTTTDIPVGSFAGTWADPAATVFSGSRGNWAISASVYVFLAGAQNGNSINDDVGLGLNVCGPNANGWGTQGSVSHT